MNGVRLSTAGPERWTALALRAGDLRASYLPGLGMVCASLTHRGEELLRRQRELRVAAERGSTAGIPFLHPWANRLASTTFTVGEARVALDPASPLLHLDANGLPIHGVPWARLAWQVQESSARSLMAYLEWSTPELLAVFPCAHRITMAVSLDERALEVRTTLRPLGQNPVPVSFGFHPYIGLPASSRAAWRLCLPSMERLVLDARGIPSGAMQAFEGWNAPLGETAWDAGFVLPTTAPGAGGGTAHGRLAPGSARMEISGAGRRVAVETVSGYPYAQVFAPAGEDCVAFEPMTAPCNALLSGQGLRHVAPGSTFAAVFRITVDDATEAE